MLLIDSINKLFTSEVCPLFRHKFYDNYVQDAMEKLPMLRFLYKHDVITK